MRFKVSLLFLIAAFVVSVQSIKVSLLTKVLQPDLDVISKYYGKGGSVPAYIHWPKSITFKVGKAIQQNAEFLKVEGTFKESKLLGARYDGLYYKDDMFYVKIKKTGELKQVPIDKPLAYIQPANLLEAAPPFLSIRYFSMEEIQKNIDLFYEDNELHLKNVMYDNPATFLLTMPHSEGHFLEYTFQGKFPYPKVEDGLLRVLVGQGTNKKVALTDNDEAYRLVFDQYSRKLSIPRELNIKSAPLENVFGVRMATTGYLAEVPSSGLVKMVNTHDVELESDIPIRHFLTKEMLLKKVKIVEPRLSYGDVQFSKKALPKWARFQVQGNVLVKSINYRQNGEINDVCPFTIEYEDKIQIFMFENKEVSKLCTDDNNLWVP